MGEFSELQGLEVEQIWIWYVLRLVFDLGLPESPGTYVDLTEFRFTDANGELHDLNVERDPAASGVALAVLRHRVVEASVADWELRLVFDTGASLVCPPRDRFEAWQASLPTSGVFCCPPGGGSDSPT